MVFASSSCERPFSVRLLRICSASSMIPKLPSDRAGSFLGFLQPQTSFQFLEATVGIDGDVHDGGTLKDTGNGEQQQQDTDSIH